MRDSAETFERLKALLSSESAALRAGGKTDLAANADSKARILLQLTQMRNSGQEIALSREQAEALIVLLNENAQVLERHMAAANRIAAGLAQHLRDADSDGTYGANQTYRGYSA